MNDPIEPNTPEEDEYARLRRRMVEEQVKAPGRGIVAPEVIRAMMKVPRHEFVPDEMKPYAYEDRPLSIGEGQTISQPYIVAFMTESLHLRKTDKVLEIGTGSGYQTAILAEIVKEVYSMEIVEPLASRAASCLKRMGYPNVFLKAGDGHQGWPECAPYDAIIVTCSPERIPRPLQEQLKSGGRMMVPVGHVLTGQQLVSLEKTESGKIVQKKVLPVIFVPMTGNAFAGE